MLSRIAFILVIGSLTIGAQSVVAQNKSADSVSAIYETSCSRAQNLQREEIKKSGLVNEVLGHLNEEFLLPHKLIVRFTCSSAGESGPYYSTETKAIIFPYAFRQYVSLELLRNEHAENHEKRDAVTEIIAALVQKELKITAPASNSVEINTDDMDELETIIDDVLLHTLYHELGHALVDILRLPITGKEEDAVDELSTLFLIENFENGEQIATNAGDFFDLESLQSDEVTEQSLFGEHSLDEQRYFNILCLVYGSNPRNGKDLFEGLDVSEGRANI
ncbi:MAG: hypothetical protein HN732_06295, partial [Rhodospirillaceae bacterium]|nr:hypothetical protein [Rhodospirillaceae bacterium]